MKRIFLVIFSFFAVSVHAEQIIMIQSKITGSQEQPKVITIVPWQKPEDPNYFGQEAEPLSLKPHEFSPLTRESFASEVRYLEEIKNKNKK